MGVCRCCLLFAMGVKHLGVVFVPPVVGAVWALLCYTITWLKMVSYIQVNYWCRKGQDDVKKLRED